LLRGTTLIARKEMFPAAQNALTGEPGNGYWTFTAAACSTSRQASSASSAPFALRRAHTSSPDSLTDGLLLLP